MAQEDYANDERLLAYRADMEAHLKAHEDGVPCPNPACPSATREDVERLVILFAVHLDDRKRRGL